MKEHLDFAKPDEEPNWWKWSTMLDGSAVIKIEVDWIFFSLFQEVWQQNSAVLTRLKITYVHMTSSLIVMEKFEYLIKKWIIKIFSWLDVKKHEKRCGME